ncbi:MAG TPA: hypothetical protein VIU82_00295 [Bosea sp. (in: a-proteobacteria)]
MAEEQIRAQAAVLAEGLAGFRRLVERYIEATGMSQTRFSYEACGQVDFVRLLRKGRNFRLDTLEAVAGYMAREKAASPSTNVA